MRATIVLIIVAMTGFAVPSTAAEIYRTVDAEGNVTFTDEPPEGGQAVERVILQPGPSPESLRDTEMRNREIRRAAESAERNRIDEKRKRDANVAQAKKMLKEAEARLEETKVIRDEDRQNLAGGKRRIHPDYFSRVNAARKEVEKAKKALREARGY